MGVCYKQKKLAPRSPSTNIHLAQHWAIIIFLLPATPFNPVHMKDTNEVDPVLNLLLYQDPSSFYEFPSTILREDIMMVFKDKSK